ncbi:MAG: carboxypeptidase-like regulatory domain-containing protein, partial [Planctomycetota bacterium]|nr:carboxypeptidase-like regulatory domain-containing protein [Planctomycetota bacterium]
MKKTRLTILVAVSVLAAAATIRAGTIAGKVSDPSGKALAGAMVSAFDKGHRKIVSVFSQVDGSFVIDGLREVKHDVRARLMGLDDEWADGVKPGAENVTFK